MWRWVATKSILPQLSCQFIEPDAYPQSYQHSHYGSSGTRIRCFHRFNQSFESGPVASRHQHEHYNRRRRYSAAVYAFSCTSGRSCSRFPWIPGYRRSPTSGWLKSLRCAINTLVVSTADCERAFSCMNETLTTTRNSLAVDTLSSLMFMSVCGPPMSAFKPEQYVTSWLCKHVSPMTVKL